MKTSCNETHEVVLETVVVLNNNFSSHFFRHVSDGFTASNLEFVPNFAQEAIRHAIVGGTYIPYWYHRKRVLILVHRCCPFGAVYETIDGLVGAIPTGPDATQRLIRCLRDNDLVARNIVFDKVGGEYCAWLNSPDEYRLRVSASFRSGGSIESDPLVAYLLNQKWNS